MKVRKGIFGNVKSIAILFVFIAVTVLLFNACNSIAEIPASNAKDLSRIENNTLFIVEDGVVRTVPAWCSIVPPLIAIAFALIFREVILSLLLGVFSGVLILKGFSIGGIMHAFAAVFDKYIVEVLSDPDHIAVILFTILIGGMVAIISKNGGMKGIINKLSKYANTAKSGQFITYLLGILIFFDDYANSLVVGNTMRPVSDRLKISREKLSYIVDSTAAPIASIAFATTWIGAELGFIEQSIELINAGAAIPVITESSYSVFLNSLKYAYYPVLTLAFIFFVILLNRDFGPMLKAERRARLQGEVVNTSSNLAAAAEDELKSLEPDETSPMRWYNAALPILVLVSVIFISLFITGMTPGIWDDPDMSLLQKLSMIIGNADAYKSLVWASAAAVFFAILLTQVQGILKIQESINSLMSGFKIMLPAIVILVLAWALSAVTRDLGTADYLGMALSEHINPYWLAELIFVIAAITAFATGSSWGTMSILYPILLPLTWLICQKAGIPQDDSLRIFYMVTSVVIAGSVFGDHCSPISDTTILSSLATSTPHIDHVRTQILYALVVAAISTLICSKLADAGLHWILCYCLGILAVFTVVRTAGKKVN